jgi:PAS domain S-box-containing protein
MEAEERFRLAIEHAPNAIVIVNSEGEISLANLQAEQDFGYSRAELIGRNVDLLVPTRFRNDHRAHRAGYQANPAIRSMGVGRELFGLRRDGSEFPIEIGLAPISMRNEKLVMATVIDITERKQAEDQLRLSIEQLTHSNEELEQFAYVASHDLQEPLRVVTSYLELIERYYADKLDADGKEYIEFTVDAARRMKSLIQDLLAFSRVGTRNEPPEIIDPNASLKTALSNLETMIAESDALIHSDNLLPVMADPSQMVLVFQNLISNSIKFRGDAPPEIRVSSRKEGGWVHFNLSDNGVGFDQKHAERIFIIFKRLHAKNEYEGTGLGLAITKKVIERHGGSIHAEGKVGKGASFFFSLPAARESFQFDEQPIKEEDSLEERARRLL